MVPAGLDGRERDRTADGALPLFFLVCQPVHDHTKNVYFAQAI
jgi:hypothetical protein